MKMNAHSVDKKIFQLIEDGRSLAELTYENLFLLNAEIKLTGLEVFKIKPVGLFQSSICVTERGVEIAKLAMNWSGEIVISYKDGKAYVLKLHKFLDGEYLLENEMEDAIIQLAPNFNWREFHYRNEIDYSITTDGNNSRDPLLLILGVYSTNLFITTMSGSNACRI